MKKYKNPIIALLAVCCVLFNTLPVSAMQEGSYRIDVKEGIVRFIRNGKMAKYPAAEPVELTVRTDKDGDLIVVLRTEDGYQNVTLGNQASLDISGEIGKLFLSASLDPGISVSVGEKSNIQELYVRNDGDVTVAGETGKVEVTGAANVIFVGSSYVETLTVTNYRASVSVRPGAIVEQAFAASGAKLSGVSAVSPLLPLPETEPPDTSDSSDRSTDSKVLDKMEDLQVPAPVSPTLPDLDNEIQSVNRSSDMHEIVVRLKKLINFNENDVQLMHMGAVTNKTVSIKTLNPNSSYIIRFESELWSGKYLLTIKSYSKEFTLS